MYIFLYFRLVGDIGGGGGVSSILRVITLVASIIANYSLFANKGVCLSSEYAESSLLFLRFLEAI